MNIKSLLIGSAAALVAVSGARAADAVVAEPEAVEYVRVCDAYGAGFFYIPGTETCLKIGGYVRYQIDFNNGDKGWRKTAKASLNFTASSDTEMGTLTSYIEVSGSRDSGRDGGLVFDDKNNNGVVNAGELSLNGTINLDHAWISLGGLKMGYSDTLYDGGLLGEGSDGGGAGIHFINYTFNGGNGFSATLALEEERNNDNYVPNVVAKVSYTAGSIGLEGWVAYDDDERLILGNDAEWSLKGRATAAVGSAGKLQLLATYNTGANFYSNGARWTVGAAYSHQINEKFALTGFVQYKADDNYDLAGGVNRTKLGLTADYTIVPGFAAKAWVVHTIQPGKDATEAHLRFQRSF